MGLFDKEGLPLEGMADALSRILSVAPDAHHETLRGLLLFSTGELQASARDSNPWIEKHWRKLDRALARTESERRLFWADALFEEIYTALFDFLRDAEDVELQDAIDAAIRADGPDQNELDALRSKAKRTIIQTTAANREEVLRKIVRETQVVHPDDEPSHRRVGRVYWMNRDVLERSQKNSGRPKTQNTAHERLLRFLGPSRNKTADSIAVPEMTASLLTVDIMRWIVGETQLDPERLRDWWRRHPYR